MTPVSETARSAAATGRASAAGVAAAPSAVRDGRGQRRRREESRGGRGGVERRERGREPRAVAREVPRETAEIRDQRDE
nr:hypothetical protein [Haloferax denitrificans]